MRDLILKVLRENENTEKDLENITDLYDSIQVFFKNRLPYLDLTPTFSKNKQKGKIILNVNSNNENYNQIWEDVVKTGQEFRNTYPNNLQNQGIWWGYFQFDFHPNVYKKFSQTKYIKEKEDILNQLGINFKDYIFSFDGKKSLPLENHIESFGTVNSNEIKQQIIDFLQSKTDVPLNVTFRKTPKIFHVQIFPQMSLQDFLNCTFSKWQIPLQLHHLDSDISEHLGFDRNTPRDWTFSTILTWPREIGNFVTQQNQKLREALNMETEESFAIRLDYFLCSKTPTITVGKGYDVYLNNKDIKSRILKKTQELGIENPTINFSQSDYWLAKQAYHTEDKRYWDKERLFDFFVEKAQSQYGKIYSYDLERFQDLETLTEVFCKKHQRWFEVVPSEHIIGKRCPFDQESKGESMVRVYLEKKGVPFKQYHKLKGCFSEINGKCILLTFDFYLPEMNIVIEYDGEQHFRPVERFGGEETFKRQVILDNIKNVFCKKNGVKMVRIPYNIKKPQEIQKFLDRELS